MVGDAVEQLPGRLVEPLEVVRDEQRRARREARGEVLLRGARDVLVQLAGVGGRGHVARRGPHPQDRCKQRHQPVAVESEFGELVAQALEPLGAVGVRGELDPPLDQRADGVEPRVHVERRAGELDDGRAVEPRGLGDRGGEAGLPDPGLTAQHDRGGSVGGAGAHVLPHLVQLVELLGPSHDGRPRAQRPGVAPRAARRARGTSAAARPRPSPVGWAVARAPAPPRSATRTSSETTTVPGAASVSSRDATLTASPYTSSSSVSR